MCWCCTGRPEYVRSGLKLFVVLASVLKFRDRGSGSRWVFMQRQDKTARMASMFATKDT